MTSDIDEVDTAPLPPAAAPKRFGGYAALVAAGIMLSRVAGLVRTSVLAHYLGATGAADAFNVALKVPNILQNLLGEGVLSASFIPVYSRLLADGKQKVADRVAGVFVSFLALIVAGIVIVGTLLTPVILAITAPGLAPDVMALAVRLTRIVFPGVGLLVMYAWALGILERPSPVLHLLRGARALERDHHRHVDDLRPAPERCASGDCRGVGSAGRLCVAVRYRDPLRAAARKVPLLRTRPSLEPVRTISATSCRWWRPRSRADQRLRRHRHRHADGYRRA